MGNLDGQKIVTAYEWDASFSLSVFQFTLIPPPVSFVFFPFIQTQHGNEKSQNKTRICHAWCVHFQKFIEDDSTQSSSWRKIVIQTLLQNHQKNVRTDKVCTHPETATVTFYFEFQWRVCSFHTHSRVFPMQLNCFHFIFKLVIFAFDWERSEAPSRWFRLNGTMDWSLYG